MPPGECLTGEAAAPAVASLAREPPQLPAHATDAAAGPIADRHTTGTSSDTPSGSGAAGEGRELGVDAVVEDDLGGCDVLLEVLHRPRSRDREHGRASA